VSIQRFNRISMYSIPEIDMNNLDSNQVTFVVSIVMGIGAWYCFFGYNTLKTIIGLTGLILAGGVAGQLIHWVTNGNMLATGIAALIGGIAGACALFFLYRTGIFAVGLLGTTLVAHNTLGDRPESWIPLAILGIGVAGGLCALVIEQPVMKLATATLGAWLIVTGAAYFIAGSPEITDLSQAFTLHEHRNIILGAWAVTSIAGAMAQWATGGKSKSAPVDLED
ncbi:MAG: TM7S3/TM198-like domain-containing protein, partial [Flavobacteriales bacterium]